jgi:hypothetical protein
MTSPKISLQEQRHSLQQQLRAQRHHILLKLSAAADTSDQYPRSKTMRFLTGRTGLVILTELASWRLRSHYPDALFAVQKLIKMFFDAKPTSSSTE